MGECEVRVVELETENKNLRDTAETLLAVASSLGEQLRTLDERYATERLHADALRHERDALLAAPAPSRVLVSEWPSIASTEWAVRYQGSDGEYGYHMCDDEEHARSWQEVYSQPNDIVSRGVTRSYGSWAVVASSGETE